MVLFYNDNFTFVAVGHTYGTGICSHSIHSQTQTGYIEYQLYLMLKSTCTFRF